MTKHTPTPWTLRKPGDIADDEAQPFYFVEVAPRRYIMAEGRTEAEANANALLCFDAPAMLEALEIAFNALRSSAGPEERASVADTLWTLIAKHMEPGQ